MSHEGRLGARKLRKIEALTGIVAVQGWAWHPNWEFRDAEDRHYVLTPATQEWHRVARPIHYNTCPNSLSQR